MGDYEFESVDIDPVETPEQFAATAGTFLPEVYTFLWLRQAQQAFDVRGRGLTVTILDTGLNVQHIDFARKVVGGRNFTSDYNGDPSNFSDGQGHGTNVGGIIVANGNHFWVAPGANIAPLKVLPNKGKGNSLAILNALGWVLTNRRKHNISAICMSLGDGSNHRKDDFDSNQVFSTIRKRLRRLRRLKVAVVVAAGNHFFNHKSKQGMSFLAIAREVISVGAVYDADVGARSYKSGAKAFKSEAGQITPFSQRLHPRLNARSYTDIFAPGAPVRSSGINGTTGESEQSGTSQATPTVAGTILLMQEFYRVQIDSLPSIYNIQRWLRRGGVRIKDGDNEFDNVKNTNDYFLRVDAISALKEVRRYLQSKDQMEILPKYLED